MSRRCAVCGRPTRDDLRHLHEIPEGKPFRLGGRVSKLLSIGAGHCTIEDPRPDREVEFETRFRGTVSFTRKAKGDRPCSGYALVEPL